MANQHVDARSAEDYVVTVPLGPHGEWTAEMQWPNGVTQGGPAVLVIHPTKADPDNRCPPGGLSQTLLRDIDFKDALDKLREHLARSKRWDRARRENHDRLTALLVDASGGAITEEYLALLSRVYVGAVNQGQDKPLDYLADITGNSAAAIKNHLWRATRELFLERSPGRAGGRVTDKAARTLVPILNAAREAQGLPPLDIGESLTETLSRLSET
jgi:hypothetical protein